MIGLLHSGSLNVKDNCSMSKKSKNFTLTSVLRFITMNILTVSFYCRSGSQFLPLPLSGYVSVLFVPNRSIADFSVMLVYPLFAYHTKLHTLCEGIRRRFPDAFLFAGTTQSRRIKAHFLGKIWNVLEAILSWIRKLWSATCSIISGSAISTAPCVIRE